MKKTNLLSLATLVLLFCVQGCKTENTNWRTDLRSRDILVQSVTDLTDVIVHDIFSPPVASRIYVYPSIAAYECAKFLEGNYQSLSGQLNGLDVLPSPESGQEYSYEVAAITAFNKVAKTFIFSEDLLQSKIAIQDSIIQSIGIPAAVLSRSVAYGQAVGQAVLDWSKSDNYAQTRSSSKYTVENTAGRWKPTPPAYMDGIEPSWREIRPMVIDSAQQFRPDFPTNYSTDPNSQFYKETMEVYTVGNELSDDHRAIASFWDCNPYVMQITGHVMMASKKITPGGHWMEICGIAIEQSNASFVKSTETYARVAIALFDGFISCWDEKYRSNLVRPETVINAIIDDTWKPLLQTPPFPEYTSGHSVISTAAAICLTELYGDNFAFTDDSETKYRLPARKFKSFLEASNEAALSRLYGGIHYRPAIDNGVQQGRNLGQYISNNVKTNKN